jgi:Zn-dependent alcohol dehydrogenase
VTVAKVGDPVILSFDFCSKCKQCKAGMPSYCREFSPLNITDSATISHDAHGNSISGGFFGQSSFTNLAIVRTNCIVNVSNLVNGREELELFAPLGCGLQTGSANITNLGNPQEGSSVAIIGLGGVGLAAIMV